MTISNDLGVYDSLGLTQSQATDQTEGELMQEDFLTLMTAQLQNQDPFEPMDNGEFLSQMAEFGTLDGIGNLETSFEDLAASLYSNQALQASTMVGKNVLVAGDSGYFDGTNAMDGAVELPSSVTDLTVTITGSGGQIVKQYDMGVQPAGMVDFSWDGTDNSGNMMPEGNYNVITEATINGENTALETMVEGVVESVTLSSGGAGLTFNIKGIGEATFDNIKQISS